MQVILSKGNKSCRLLVTGCWLQVTGCRPACPQAGCGLLSHKVNISLNRHFNLFTDSFIRFLKEISRHHNLVIT